MAEQGAMNMLYRIEEGAVREQHYGLALARVVPLPPQVIDRATAVAQELERRTKARKNTSAAVTRERRRKLLLSLREHLVQAQTGSLEGEALASWLRKLQKEFVLRMTAVMEAE